MGPFNLVSKFDERTFVEALSGNRAGDGRQGFPACAAALWQVRAAVPGKLLFHCVERFNVRQLDREGLLARIAHDQQHEAVAVNDVHGEGTPGFIEIVTERKIARSELFRAVIRNIADVP